MALLNYKDLLKEEDNIPTTNLNNPSSAAPQVPSPQSQPSEWEKAKNSFQLYNPIASAISNGFNDDEIKDPSYDRFTQLKGTEWEPFMDKFIYADNDDEMSTVKNKITKEMEMANTAANSGWTGTIYNFAAGLLDPTLAIPVLGTANKVRTLAGIAKTAASVSASSAAAIGIQEAALHQTQVMKTKEESAYNVAAGAVLGGVLGGAIGMAVGSKLAPAKNYIKTVLETGEPPRIPVPVGSAGAAEAQVSDASIAYLNRGPVIHSTVPGFRPPLVEGLTSESPLLKDITSRLFENNWIKERNRIGIKTDDQVLQELEKQGYKNVARLEGDTAILADETKIPFNRTRAATEEPKNVETLLKEDMSENLQYRKDIEATYQKYLGNATDGALKGERSWLSAKKQGKKTLAEFNDAVARGARRTEKTGDPFVDKGVEFWRAMITKQNEKMKALAEPGNILEKFSDELELKGRESYFTIVPDRVKAAELRAETEAKITNHYVTTKGMDPDEARSIASEHLDRLIGLDGAGTISEIAQKTVSLDKGIRFTKDREWDIPDTLLEDILVNDAMHIGNQYIDNSNKLIRFQGFLNDMGVKNVAELKDKLKGEFDTSVAKLPKDHPEYNLQRQKIQDEYVKNAKLLDDFLAISLGQYSTRTPADRALRHLRTFNYIRLMGYIVPSSLTDIAMPIFKHGLGKTFMDGYVSGIKSWAAGARKLVNDDLSDIYAALDTEMSNTLQTIIDPDFVSKTSSSTLDNTLGWASDKHGKLSGIHYWNLVHKRLAARVAESRIIRDIKNYDSLPVNEKEYLNSLGIGAKDIKGLSKELETYASDHNGAWITNIKEWRNTSAKEKFRRAIITEVDGTIVTPGKGDISRVQQRTEVARTLLQFKGFFSAMTTKVLISGMQKRDSNTIQGVIGLLAIGAASYNLRMALMGKSPNNDAGNLMLESWNRTGLGGLIMDPVFGLVLRPWTSGTRYMNQSAVEYPLGPSSSLIKDLATVYGKGMNLEFDDKMAKSAGHLIPYQNLFWLRALLGEYKGEEVNKK